MHWFLHFFTYFTKHIAITDFYIIPLSNNKTFQKFLEQDEAVFLYDYSMTNYNKFW